MEWLIRELEKLDRVCISQIVEQFFRLSRDIFVLDVLRWQIEHEDVEYKVIVLERLAATIARGKAVLIDPYTAELASYPKIEFKVPKELDVGK